MVTDRESGPLVDRMTHLLLQVPQQRREAEMDGVVNRLWAAGLLNSQPSRRDPETFSRELFQMADLPVPIRSHTLYSIKGAESPQDMVGSLIPSDHHGD